MLQTFKQAEVIARRKTMDGELVKLWNNGSITTSGFNVVVGQPARTQAQFELYLTAGWLLMGEVEVYDKSEIRSLLEAARWAAKRNLGPGGMRKRLAQQQQVTLKPIWTTLQADRDGRPTLQCWVLPRLRWPGLSVWREHGIYSLGQEMGRKSGIYEPTGFKFKNLKELTAHLLSTG
jgi:hypothetical protein